MEDKVLVPYYITEEQRLMDVNKGIVEGFLVLQKIAFPIYVDNVSTYNKNVKIIKELRDYQPMTKEEYEEYDQTRNISNT